MLAINMCCFKTWQVSVIIIYHFFDVIAGIADTMSLSLPQTSIINYLNEGLIMIILLFYEEKLFTVLLQLC